MQKVIPAAAIMLLVFIASCKKDSSTALNAWSFKGTSYLADSSSFNSAGGGAVFANTTGSELIVYFTNGLPASTTTYTVAVGGKTMPAGHVYIALNTTAADYYSTGGNGTNQTVTVNVSGNKITLSGSNIELVNTTVPADSSSAGFNMGFTN